MNLRRTVFLVLMAVLSFPAMAQLSQDEITVDYNNPRKYVVGGIEVEGNHYFSPDQIIQVSGLQKGLTVTVPGDDVSSIVDRLWLQRYFEDVAVVIDSIAPSRDTAFFKICITERPRVSRWTFSGVKSGEQKELLERLNLRRGGEFSDYVAKTATDIIKRYYKEKGFLLTEVNVQTAKDTLVKSAIRVNFAVDRKQKVKIKKITFTGNDNVKEGKLVRSMKKTKDARLINFFSSKKFNEKEFPNDKRSLISAFNEAGYRDARIVKDTMYYIEPNRLEIDFTIDEGKKYYFRNITWTGNSVYSSDALNNILMINKGDVYDVVTMEKRLFGGGKQNEYDVSKLYRDNGYLFFNIQPVEVNIVGDSVDVEMRIVEGKPATLNNIIINGNDLTNERVVRRQIFTRPGYLFSQTDFERSIREIASMGQFDPEAIADPSKGYSILPNQLDNTVDIVYNVTEKPSSTLELSGGWGGNTFVATVGVSFNNFSTRRLFDKSAWRPVPLGDAQNLSLRFQTNGTYYTSLSASFMEPWLFGKKPTSLSISAYYTRQTNSYIAFNILNNDEFMEVYGLAAGIGTRLKWPDNYFVLYNQLSWQTYRLQNWNYNFLFNTGISHNLSYTVSLSRTSTDQQIYPRQGSEFSLSLQLTPPYSLLRRKNKGELDANGNPTRVSSWRDINYDLQSSEDRYKWIEYHKWSFKGAIYTKLVGDLVLMARAQFGYLGYYNRNWGYSPFEGFLVGGDGMSGYNTYGTEVISLRGYENYSLTPTAYTPYSSGGTAYTGNVYDKFTVELRYPVVLQPQSTIFALVFLEGGNCWSDIRDFNPFQIKRSAGVGVRVFLPMIGLLGVDWGYGFDDPVNGKSQFHFVIGQQF
ncbi:MAG: BamA/TamA family outer membrane protein [Bacteroidetes bacterium]|uniref:BamA/TamA family outer membrane protein n=1 Tax=Candidatus Cryptobacteroides intestinigallinarum TaxID=2840767 RepID=A0A9D9N0D1_9BACT|nr:BamA/TamA family outer membrane protein [Candidatus Cryptobacteroides intestinigallinarum]